MRRLDNGLKSQSYGRFGFAISQPDGGRGPFTLYLTGLDAKAELREVTVELSEDQGLLLIADLVEFGAEVMRRRLEDAIYARTA